MSSSIFRARLDKELSESSRKFLSSMEEDMEFFEEEIKANLAHVLMLNKQGFLSNEEAKNLLIALNEIKPEELKEAKSKYEDIHEFIEARLTEKLGDPAKKLQTGRSRNDQVATITRMKIRSLILDNFNACLNLIETLLNRAEKDINALIVYRTHRRDAQISSLAHYWLAQAISLFRSLDRLIEAYKRCNLSPLGSSASAGTLIPIDRRYTAKLLCFDEVLMNSLDGVTSRDYILDALNALICIMIDLSRISEDLISWDEKKIVELDERHCSVSSIMPHKKNPDTLEMIKAKTKEVISSYLALSEILSSLPSGYNRELQRVKIIAVKACKEANESIEMMNEIISSLRFNEDNSREHVSKSESIAVDLAEFLTLKKKRPFREIHEKVAKVFKNITNENLREEIKKNFEEISDEDLELLLSYESILNLRKSEGSPNPDEVEKMLKISKKDLSKYKKFFIEEKDRLENNFKNLNEEIQKLINIS